MTFDLQFNFETVITHSRYICHDVSCRVVVRNYIANPKTFGIFYNKKKREAELEQQRSLAFWAAMPQRILNAEEQDLFINTPWP